MSAPPPEAGGARAGAAEPVPRVAAVILAAGSGSRYADGHKLLAPLRGKPLLRWTAEAALAAATAPVVVVLGHSAERVRPVLADLPVLAIDNPDYGLGLSASLRVGLAALAPATAAAVVLLADMPLVTAQHIDALIAAFAAGGEQHPCVPVRNGRRGNPVLWPARLFPALAALTGDRGGRDLLAADASVIAVEMADDAVLIDIDDVGALAALRAHG